MAQINFNNVPDEAINKIVLKFGWTADLGVSKVAFFKRFIADYVKGTYTSIVQEEGAEAARIAAKTIDIT